MALTSLAGAVLLNGGCITTGPVEWVRNGFKVGPNYGPPPAHVADTRANRPYARERDARSFLRSGDLEIPRRYGAGWIVLDRKRTKLELKLPRVYADARYSLYRL